MQPLTTALRSLDCILCCTPSLFNSQRFQPNHRVKINEGWTTRQTPGLRDREGNLKLLFPHAKELRTKDTLHPQIHDSQWVCRALVCEGRVSSERICIPVYTRISGRGPVRGQSFPMTTPASPRPTKGGGGLFDCEEIWDSRLISRGRDLPRKTFNFTREREICMVSDLHTHTRPCGADAECEFVVNFPSDSPPIVIIEKCRWATTHGGNKITTLPFNITVGLGRGSHSFQPRNTRYGHGLLQRKKGCHDEQSALETEGKISPEQLIPTSRKSLALMTSLIVVWTAHPNFPQRWTSAGICEGVLGMIGLSNSDTKIRVE